MEGVWGWGWGGVVQMLVCCFGDPVKELWQGFKSPLRQGLKGLFQFF